LKQSYHSIDQYEPKATPNFQDKVGLREFYQMNAIKSVGINIINYFRKISGHLSISRVTSTVHQVDEESL